MNEEKHTIGKEIGEIISNFITHIICAGVGCYITLIGVIGILAFISDKENGFDAVICIVLGIFILLVGLRVLLVQIYRFVKVCIWCSEFSKTEIAVKRDWKQ